MRAIVQPMTPEAPATASAPVETAPTEVVTRPDPGLARGVWEAPPWAFWAALAAVVVLATLYALYRTGILRKPGATTKVL